jgi:hypothetical protein
MRIPDAWVIISALASLVSSACATADDRSSRRIRLADTELQLLFSDIELHEVDPPMIFPYPTYEEFHSDGTYIRRLDRGNDIARFLIKGGEVCVTGMMPRCRRISIMDGHLYLSERRGNSEYLRKYSIKKLTK